MSKRSIPNVDWANQLENVIRQLKGKIRNDHAGRNQENFPRNRTSRKPNRGKRYFNESNAKGRVEGFWSPNQKGNFKPAFSPPKHTGAGGSPKTNLSNAKTVKLASYRTNSRKSLFPNPPLLVPISFHPCDASFRKLRRMYTAKVP